MSFAVPKTILPRVIASFGNKVSNTANPTIARSVVLPPNFLGVNGEAVIITDILTHPPIIGAVIQWKIVINGTEQDGNGVTVSYPSSLYNFEPITYYLVRRDAATMFIAANEIGWESYATPFTTQAVDFTAAITLELLIRDVSTPTPNLNSIASEYSTFLYQPAG